MARILKVDGTRESKVNYKRAFAIFLLGQISVNAWATQAIGGPAAYVVDGGTTNANITVGSKFDQAVGTLMVGFSNNPGTVDNSTAPAPPPLTAAVASTAVDTASTIRILNGSSIKTVDGTSVIAFDGSGGSIAPAAACLLTINNAGTIANQNFPGNNNPAGNAIVGDALGMTSLQLTNTAAQIFGAINMSKALIANSITNTGSITGAINLGAARDTLTNSGTITGTITGGASGDTINNNTTGIIIGNITGGGTANNITNNGSVTGDIIPGAFGGDTITNNIAATITGNINGVLSGPAANNITNNGTVTLDITSGPGADIIINTGTVRSIIGGAAGNRITNSATVTGTITGNAAANNTIILNGGTVAGIINGGAVGKANVLNIGGDFITAAAIQNLQTINVNAGTFTIANPVTNVVTTFTTFADGAAIVNSSLDGGGTITNGGTLTLAAGGTIGAAGAMGLVTNNGTMNINAAAVANAFKAGAINNNGSFTINNTFANAFNSGIITNNGSCTINNSVVNAGIALGVGGGVTNPATGTLTVTNTTGLTAALNLGNFTANAGILNINGAISITPGAFNNIGTTNVSANLDIGGAGKIFTNNGTVNMLVPAAITGDYTNKATHIMTINNGAQATLTASKVDFGTNPNTIQIKTAGNTLLASGQVINIATATLPAAPVVLPGPITIAALSTTLTYSAPVIVGQNIQTTVTRIPLSSLVSGANESVIASTMTSIYNNNVVIQPDMKLVLAAIDQLPTSAAITQAMTQLLPTVQSGQMLAGFTSSNLAVGAIEGRINNIARSEIYGIDNLYMNRKSGYAAGSTAANRNFWIKGFSASNNQKALSDSNGYNANTLGIILGADNQVTSNSWLGIGISYAYTKVRTNNFILNSTAFSSYQTTLYGSHSLEKYYIDGFVAVAYNKYSSLRNISFGTLNRAAAGKFFGLQPSVKIGSGYIHQYNDLLQIIPNSSLQYTYLHQQQYTEFGAGGISLKKISTNDLQQLEGGVGIKFAMLYKDKVSTTSQEIHFMTLYDVISSNQQTTAQFTGGGGNFTINGTKIPRATFNIGLGCSYVLMDRLHCTINYDLRVKKQFIGHSGSLAVKYSV